jgi:hypothetical protein
MLERLPPGAVWKECRKLVPLILAVKYVAVQKRHLPAAGSKFGESFNLGGKRAMTVLKIY